MNWKRIIVDSRHRTADSVSSSDFFVDLPPTHVPAGSQLFIDGVCLSVAWPVVGPGRDKLYVQEDVVGGSMYIRAVSLPHGSYNSITLATAVAAHLNSGSHLAGTYGTSVANGAMTFTNSSDPTTQGKARIFSRSAADQDYLKQNFPGYLGEDVNEILGLWETPVLADGTSWIFNGQSQTGSFLDLAHTKQAFIHCESLGETSTITCGGDTTVLRRIVLGGSSVQGDVVVDTLSTGLAATHFDADTTLGRLHFQIKDWAGNLLSLAHHEVSWEMIIQRP